MLQIKLDDGEPNIQLPQHLFGAREGLHVLNPHGARPD